MDQTALVSDGHRLIHRLQEDGYDPRAVLWVHNREAGTWRLWIVPPTRKKGETEESAKREFYRQISTILAKHQGEFSVLDAADVDLRDEDHPVIKGVCALMKVDRDSLVSLSNTTLNGFFIPTALVLFTNL